MNIENLSTRGLRMLHDGITRAMATDEALPPDRRSYGVRLSGDWHEQADRIEAELTRRGEAHMPLAW